MNVRNRYYWTTFIIPVFLRANTTATIYFIHGYYSRAVTNQGWCLLTHHELVEIKMKDRWRAMLRRVLLRRLVLWSISQWFGTKRYHKSMVVHTRYFQYTSQPSSSSDFTSHLPSMPQEMSIFAIQLSRWMTNNLFSTFHAHSKRLELFPLRGCYY